MKNILGKVMAQKKVGRQWGVIAQTAAQVGIFVGLMNLFLVAVTAYNTTLSEWFAGYGIHIGFWTFALIIIGLMVVALFLAWKFLLGSYYSSFNEQFYRHDNPIKKELGDIKKLLNNDLRNLEERVEKLEKKRK